MRARLPKFAAALCAAVALVSAPLAAAAATTGLAPVVTAADTAADHWYDAPGS